MSNMHRTPSGAAITGFPSRAVEITPSDTTTFDTGIMVFVGTGGDVVVEPLEGGNTVTFAVGDGGVVPVTCRRVLAATTATGIVGVY